MDIIIKTFSTPGGNYVYDRETNALLSVNDKEFAACQRVEAGTDTEDDQTLLQRYKDQGYFKESRLTKIEHPATPYLRHQLENNINQLTIQVCRTCNLRCAYCSYGGNYHHQRTHSNETMPLDMMKKCADFLMTRSHSIEEVFIGLYGGESLLAFGNIKKLVTYIKETYKGRKVTYSVTTNGTIFNDDILQFMQDNNFNVGISFDGPKELHDKNRKYASGKGSYDDIMANMTMIKEKYPEFFKRIRFITTVAPGVDFACINEFYTAEDILAENGASANSVNTMGAKTAVEYDDKYIIAYKYQLMKCLLAEMGLYSKGKTSRLFADSMYDLKRTYAYLGNIKLKSKSHPAGPCIPGVTRPFVDVHGNILPCERVGEMTDALKIGHIDTGFDLEKATAILNIGKTTAEACISCWNFSHCNLCAGHSDNGQGKLSATTRLSHCEGLKNNTLQIFKTICLLQENGADMTL